MLRKTKSLIPPHTLTMLYNSIIAPNFDYRSVVWDTCGVTEKKKLQVLQNMSAKIINGTSYYSLATEALAQLNWDALIKEVQI